MSQSHFKTARDSARKSRVLIVESDKVQAMNLEHIVLSAGCEVVIADRSKDAIELVEKTPPDAAILEVRLSDSDDAFPIAQALKARKIPFIFATAAGREVTRNAGFKEITLLKPLERGVVEKMIVYLTSAPRTA